MQPKMTHDLVVSFLAGNLNKSRKIQLHLYELIKALFIETNPIPTKTILGWMGLIKPNLRLPLCALSRDNSAKLKAIAKKYHLI